MATNYNITMKRYNGTDYDILYPRTLPSQIDGGVYTKDEATGLFLSKTGGQMSGLLDMNGNKISNLAAPTAANDAATKDYVDNNSYMWNKVLLHEWTAVGSVWNMPLDNIDNIIGFYVDASFSFTATAGSPTMETLSLIQVRDANINNASTATWFSSQISTCGLNGQHISRYYMFLLHKNFGFATYAGSDISSIWDCGILTVIDGGTTSNSIYYDASGTIMSQFQLSQTRDKFSNIDVKLYGLYEK